MPQEFLAKSYFLRCKEGFDWTGEDYLNGKHLIVPNPCFMASRVLQPYTKEELRSMHQQGDSDLGISQHDDSSGAGKEDRAEASNHDKVFVPQLGWVDQSKAELQGQLRS